MPHDRMHTHPHNNINIHAYIYTYTPQQTSDLLFVLKITADSLLQKQSKLLDPLVILVFVLPGFCAEKLDDTFCQYIVEAIDKYTILHGLAGKVEGEILRVNNTLCVRMYSGESRIYKWVDRCMAVIA